MGHKVNPIGLRLGINRTWDSRWYAKKGEYGQLLHEDLKIREFLEEKLKAAGVSKIVIERPHKKCRVTVHSAEIRWRNQGRHSCSEMSALQTTPCACPCIVYALHCSATPAGCLGKSPSTSGMVLANVVINRSARGKAAWALVAKLSGRLMVV